VYVRSDNDELRRAQDLSARDDPKLIISSNDRELPTFDIPMTEIEDARRLKLRMETEEPRRIKSNTDTEELSRE